NPGSATVCLPFDPQATIGGPCENLGDCTLGAFCIPDGGAGGQGPRFPGGYCSDSCNPQGGGGNACGNDNFCVSPDPRQPAQGFCVDGCSQDTQCRTGEGYVCQAIGQQRRGCIPG